MGTRNYIIKILQVILGIIFLYAGLKKVWEGDLFYHTLLSTPYSESQVFAEWGSIGFPVVEILTGVFLLLFPRRLIGVLISFGLMLLYTAYLVILLFFGDGIPCTCRTVLPFLGWYGHLYFTLSCLVLTLLLLLLRLRKI